MAGIALQNGEPILLSQVLDSVFVLTLNRPHAKHAFDLALANALSDGLDRFDEDGALSVAVITGSQGMFSSGADPKALMRGERAHTDKRGAFGILKRPPEKPLIAAVEGHAFAGGLELALCADLIVASIDARFGLPGIRRGVDSVGAGLLRLPGRIPYHVAMDMALTGELYSASRLHEMGLVNVVTEPGDALDEAIELANSVAQPGLLTARWKKQIIHDCYAQMNGSEAGCFTDAAQSSEGAKEESREAVPCPVAIRAERSRSGLGRR